MSHDWQSMEHAADLEVELTDVFSIRDIGYADGGRVVVFRGQFLHDEESAHDLLRERFGRLGYVPLFRRHEGHHIVIAHPAPPAAAGSRPWVNGVLFGLTVVSTLWAGGFTSGQLPEAGAPLAEASFIQQALAHLRLGVPFASALLAILVTHEFGHYFMARRYGLDVSLPYFIPFPNPLAGTLGAFIRIRSPFASRKALFDVGIAGPLAGLAVALAVILYALQGVRPVVPPPGSGYIAEPLLFRWLVEAIVGPRLPGMDIMMTPLLWAGWWGLFVTALNLLPLSQLDGGHIAYALLGRMHRYLAWGLFLLLAGVTVAGLQVDSLAWARNWIILLGLIFLIGPEHPPALNDITSLDGPRRVLGVATLLLFFLLITPNPFPH
jgi:Zn-dependent protease